MAQESERVTALEARADLCAHQGGDHETRIHNISQHIALLERELIALRNRVLELEARMPEPTVAEIARTRS